jgi:predicted nucleic acid-binding protein
VRAYIDSDILIWHLRGHAKALAFLSKLRDEGHYELWTGALQRAEVVFFMRPGEEDATGLFLGHFRTARVDEAIVDTAGALFRTWRPSHGTDPNDALLAATALLTGGRIFTLNEKHYPMPDVSVERAWPEE